VLAACSDRPLDKLDPPVLDVLRLGTHQLLSTRVGAHAAVATSVDLARSVAGPRVAGYVNAVLRRVATRDLAAWLPVVAPNPAADPDGYLAIRHSHPRWIVESIRAALGDQADDELAAALEAGNARPKVTLAAFPAGQPRADVMPDDATPGQWSPYAFTLQSGDPAPLIDSGNAAVQDEASQLAAIALARAPLAARRSGGSEAGPGVVDDREAELWLDMCAGPGGKSRMLYGLARLPRSASAQAAAAAEPSDLPGIPQARLVAAEIHPHRASLVSETLARASRSIADTSAVNQSAVVITADGTHPAWQAGVFDRVLVDVPCSGVGALRRRPEARWRKQEQELPALAELQRELLRSALEAVRPGGIVAYVTCSPVPAETTDVVTAVAAEAPNVIILDTPAALSNVPDVRSSRPQFAQLWPHRHGTDAIFIALLRRATQ